MFVAMRPSSTGEPKGKQRVEERDLPPDAACLRASVAVAEPPVSIAAPRPFVTAVAAGAAGAQVTLFAREHLTAARWAALLAAQDLMKANDPGEPFATVLAARHTLIQAQWYPGALSVALGTKQGRAQVLLIAHTDHGTALLDPERPTVAAWTGREASLLSLLWGDDWRAYRAG